MYFDATRLRRFYISNINVIGEKRQKGDTSIEKLYIYMYLGIIFK